jgi:methylated-DNA-[protein]-cysteine S-methyltransferase
VWSKHRFAAQDFVIWFMCDASGSLVAIDFGDDPQGLDRFALAHRAQVGQRPPAFVQAATDEFDAYFRGTLARFSLPLRLFGTDFSRRVWAALIEIPFGQVKSYGELAAELAGEGDGKKQSSAGARAVGMAAGRNPLPIVIPCHRLIAANGAIGGFTGGLAIKRRLLNHEARQALARPPQGGVQLDIFSD